MIRRRGFLIGLAGACAAVTGWRIFASRNEDGITAVINRRLGYLVLEPGGLRRFARDLDAKQQMSARLLRSIGVIAPLYRHLPFGGDRLLPATVRYSEDSIVTSYLLSSDFFTRGPQETGPLQYLALYDAERACSNPFARPAVPIQSETKAL